MKYFAKLLAVSLLLSTAAVAQTFLPQQPEPPGPVKIPDAPQLPYHFDTNSQGSMASNSAMSRPWQSGPTAICWCSTATPTS